MWGSTRKKTGGESGGENRRGRGATEKRKRKPEYYESAGSETVGLVREKGGGGETGLPSLRTCSRQHAEKGGALSCAMATLRDKGGEQSWVLTTSKRKGE